MKELYDHSANAQGKRHCLDSHLKEVASLSQKFANKFNTEGHVYQEVYSMEEYNA